MCSDHDELIHNHFLYNIYAARTARLILSNRYTSYILHCSVLLYKFTLYNYVYCTYTYNIEAKPFCFHFYFFLYIIDLIRRPKASEAIIYQFGKPTK